LLALTAYTAVRCHALTQMVQCTAYA
jgi:hypothetical protein